MDTTRNGNGNGGSVKLGAALEAKGQKPSLDHNSESARAAETEELMKFKQFHESYAKLAEACRNEKDVDYLIGKVDKIRGRAFHRVLHDPSDKEMCEVLDIAAHLYDAIIDTTKDAAGVKAREHKDARK